MSVLQSIILVTALAGTASVLVAASFSLTLLSKMVNNMVSLSVGILLATALLHTLPGPFSWEAQTLNSYLQPCWRAYSDFSCSRRLPFFVMTTIMKGMVTTIITAMMLKMLAVVVG